MEYKFPSMNQNNIQIYSFKRFFLNKKQGPISKRLDSKFFNEIII